MNLLLDVDFDAATAEGNGVFGFADLRFDTTGDVVFDETPNCQVSNCTVNFTPTSFVLTSDDTNGQFDDVFDLLEVTITGTQGVVQISDGKYLDGGLSQQDVAPMVIANVPEPTAGLLVGLGLTGLALQRRPRSQVSERAASS